MTDRVLLLAGSVGVERVPARPHPDDADWFLPLHVRDEAGARERLAAQVAAGADVVVAPTWLTHRRALLPLGETRRAGTWTAAAVNVARQALEIGLERRESALAEVPDDDVRHGRPTPRVAAVLPALDDERETATGRLLPHEAATERDYRDQAGAITDAEPDLILVEGQRVAADARTAMAEAAQTGLPVWAALAPEALASTELETWIDRAITHELERLLLPGPLADRRAALEAPLAWGMLAPSDDPLAHWLAAGAGAVAWLDGAVPAVLESLRSAIDDVERAGIEAERAAKRRWQDHLRRAAAIAPGGAAAIVGRADDPALPAGFDWTAIERHELPYLPPERFRLLVDRDAPIDDDGARALEPGGIAVCPPAQSGELRLLELDERADPPLAIYRREA
ncbi:MAG: homocysteine S-methyltransferase family protein [Candidatus Limnocylindrales bacterium]